MSSEPAENKHSGLIPYKPGQSGNPAGRPKGSRNKLGEAFISDLYASWQRQGADVIDRVIAERPQDYLKVIASILPKQLEIKSDAFDGITDEQLGALIAAARSALGIAECEPGSAPTAH